MRRRDFISGLTGVAATRPFPARAQSADRVRRVACLNGTAAADVDAQADLAAFKQSLQTLGWKPGGTIVIDERWAGGNLNRVEAYAAELVGMHPDVILTAGIAPTTSSIKATKIIPCNHK